MLEFFKRNKEKSRELDEIANLLGDEITERRAQRDQARLVKVEELFGAQQSIIEQRTATMPALESAAAIALSDEAQIARELETARQRRISADIERLSASLEFTAKMNSVKAEIRKLAPPVIDVFIDEMQKEWQAVRLRVDVRERQGETNFITGRHKIHFVSNKDSIERRVSTIRHAIDEAELLKTSTLSETEIIEHLELLGNSLPDIHDEHSNFPAPNVSELKRQSA